VAFVRTEVSEENVTSIIRVKRISELRTLAVTNIPLIMEEIRSSETSFIARATRRHISKEDIPNSYSRGSPEAYVALIGWAL
jgi:hypothetical protein